MTRENTSDVEAADLFERERNMGECTRKEVATVPNIFSSDTTKKAERP